jgi:FAD:protein FMN transferase
MTTNTLHTTDRGITLDSRVMGSHLRIVMTDGDEAALVDAVARLGDLEAKWSRFLSTSDISRLNVGGGRAVKVSCDTIDLIRMMIDAHVKTRGLFDPTMIVPMLRLGFGGQDDCEFVADSRGEMTGIRIDADASTVSLPVGTALDAGGIGKGLAADLVIDEFVDRRCRGMLVSIGGDVVVSGDAPEGQAWVVSILDPTAEFEVDRLHLERGAVATSSIELKRLGNQHHLLDPSTTSPTRNGIRSATVVAGSGAWAEAFTKPLMIAGRPWLDQLDRIGLGASVTDLQGRTANSTWSDLVVKQ